MQKIPGMGNIDDVKEVADGYALNYLFPNHLAVQASKKSLADLTAHKTKLAKDAGMELSLIQSQAAKLDGLEIEFKEKTNENGLLYSAVGPQKIVEALKRQGYDLKKDQIKTQPLKLVGEYEVKISFKHGLEAVVNIIITKA